MSVRIHSFFVCDLCGILEVERVTSKHCPFYELRGHSSSEACNFTFQPSNLHPVFLPAEFHGWKTTVQHGVGGRKGCGEGSVGLCRKALEPQRGEGTPRSGRDASGRHVHTSLGAGCAASLHSSHCHARRLYRWGPAFQSLLASHVAVDNVSHSLSFTLLHGKLALPI